MQKKWKGIIAKLVSSTIELWEPTQDLAWPPQYLHHPTQGSIPFIATQFPQAIHSLPVVFRVYRKDFPAPLDLSMRFLSSLGLSATFGPLPLLGIQPKTGMHITTIHKETQPNMLYSVKQRKQGSIPQ